MAPPKMPPMMPSTMVQKRVICTCITDFAMTPAIKPTTMYQMRCSIPTIRNCNLACVHSNDCRVPYAKPAVAARSLWRKGDEKNIDVSCAERMARPLARQQDLAKLRIPVILIRARTNRLQHIQPLAADLLERIHSAPAREVTMVGG